MKKILTLLFCASLIFLGGVVSFAVPGGYLASNEGELTFVGTDIHSGSQPLYMEETTVGEVIGYLDYNTEAVTLTFYGADGVTELHSADVITDGTTIVASDGVVEETYTLVYEKLLNNGLLKFQTGTLNDSIVVDDSLGSYYKQYYYSNLAGPQYYNSGTWYNLSISSIPTDLGFATGGVDNNGWNNEGNYSSNPPTCEVIYHIYNGVGYIDVSAPYVTGTDTLDTVIRYTLNEDDSYATIQLNVTNPNESTLSNVRMWMGVNDDWIATSDSPTKTRGNIVDGEFVALSAADEMSDAIKISSGIHNALFITNADIRYSMYHYLSSLFGTILNVNPASLSISYSGDNSYALYSNLGDLAPGASTQVNYYYVAGSSADLSSILSKVEEVISMDPPVTPVLDEIAPLNADFVDITGHTTTGAIVTITSTSDQYNTTADEVGDFSAQVPLVQNTTNVFSVYAGNEAGDSDSTFISIVEDSILPVITVTSDEPDPSSSELIPVTIAISEATSTLGESSVVVDGGTIFDFSQIDDQHYLLNVNTVNITTSSPVHVYVHADAVSDEAGNENIQSNLFAILSDHDAVTATLTTEVVSPTATTTALITIQLSDPPVGLTASDIEVVGGSVSEFTQVSDTEFTFILNIPESGAVTVRIPEGRFTDLAGNDNTPSNTLTLLMNPHEPEALTDAITVSQNGSVTADFNVSDLDGDPLLVALYTAPAHGSVVISGLSYTYTPLVGYAGEDHFTYAVTDGYYIVIGEVNVTVNRRTTSSGTQVKPSEPVYVIVDGVNVAAGSVETALDPNTNRTVLTLSVDPVLVTEQLEQSLGSPMVILNIPSGAAENVSVLTAQMIKEMENRRAMLQINTALGNYNLDTGAINIDQVRTYFGESVNLSDIEISIKIAEATAEQIAQAIAAMQNGGADILVTPVTFDIVVSYNGEEHTLSQFTSYVNRTIPIPDGVDPGKITTAVVIEANGSYRHVPTKVIKENGVYYAVINSLTNSVYTLVYHEASFEDVQNHWAEEAILNLASRTVVSGNDSGAFLPDAAITRAEFTAMIVKALGLEVQAYTGGYADVTGMDWYADYIATANQLNLVSGYSDGTFRPEASITREEAMAIVAKSVGLTGLDDSMTAAKAVALIEVFGDAGTVSDWAADGVGICLNNNLVSGYAGNLNPKADITRAEAAVILENLLKVSGLIQ
jgi:hypothetical protein